MSWTMISESEVVWKYAPSRSRLRAQIAEIDEVAVVRDGDEALGGVDANGLRVEQRRVAGGGVARVADGHVAGELGENIVSEDFRNQAHAFDVGEMLAVGGGDAG